MPKQRWVCGCAHTVQAPPLPFPERLIFSSQLHFADIMTENIVLRVVFQGLEQFRPNFCFKCDFDQTLRVKNRGIAPYWFLQKNL